MTKAKAATSRYYTITTNFGRQHQQTIFSRSPTFTFQWIPMRAQAKVPERQEGGTNSILKKPIKFAILEAAILLGKREHLLLGDWDSTNHQTWGTNKINQCNNYLLELGVTTR
jgi:hypothetical protein